MVDVFAEGQAWYGEVMNTNINHLAADSPRDKSTAQKTASHPSLSWGTLGS